MFLGVVLLFIFVLVMIIMRLHVIDVFLFFLMHLTIELLGGGGV